MVSEQASCSGFHPEEFWRGISVPASAPRSKVIVISEDEVAFAVGVASVVKAADPVG